MLAREGLLAGVSANVTLQEPRPRECLAAQVTLAGQGVCSNVHFQCTQGGVLLLAKLADKCLFRLVALRRGAVELLVFGQP